MYTVHYVYRIYTCIQLPIALGKHLQDIVSGEVRPISNALHEHARSWSVNLHVAELILLTARMRQSLRPRSWSGSNFGSWEIWGISFRHISTPESRTHLRSGFNLWWSEPLIHFCRARCLCVQLCAGRTPARTTLNWKIDPEVQYVQLSRPQRLSGIHT